MADPLRRSDGKYQKGQSGNPGGRNRDLRLRRLRRSLEALDPKMLVALESMVDDADPKIKAVAVQVWAKYRIPVPKQDMDEARPITSPVLSPELAARLAGLQ